MKHIYLYIFAVIFIIIITLVFLFFYDKNEDENIKFLRFYGWKVSDAYIEKENITIPDTFDKIYEDYNKLQLNAGLDLSPYKGFQAVRYTYIVENYPSATPGTVLANVICVDNIPIAGDIMSRSIDGFMYSLKSEVTYN